MAGICPECITGNKLAGTLKGTNVDKHALPAYFASATRGDHNSPVEYTTKALVISPDIFGFGIDNPKLLADLFAEKCGLDVWAVDTFNGNPPVREAELAPYMQEYAGQRLSWLTTIGKYAKMLTYLPTLWSLKPANQEPALIEFIGQLRREYKYEKIGLIGYCWGGAHAVSLAAQPGIIDVALPCHPGSDFKTHIRDAVVPIAYSIPEEDGHWPAGFLESVQAAIDARSNAPKHRFTVYPGTVHGFGSRPNLGIPQIKTSWEGYVSDTVGWVKETM